MNEGMVKCKSHSKFKDGKVFCLCLLENVDVSECTKKCPRYHVGPKPYASKRRKKKLGKNYKFRSTIIET